MWKFTIAIMLCCAVTSARDWVDEFASSPAYLILAGSKSEVPGTHYSKPTGKYKALADDVINRVKAADPKMKPEAWTEYKPGDDKPGLVVVYPISHNFRVDDNYKRCHCPNSVFTIEIPPYGEPEKPEWLNGTLETWMRLDHGWNDQLARSTMPDVTIAPVIIYPAGPVKNKLWVDISLEQINKYYAKRGK